MTGPGGTVEGFSAPDLIDDSSVGIFAVHAVRATLPVLVAPTTDDAPNAFNTIRDPLVTIGCANLPDDHFAFDSSVLGANSIEGFKKFGALLRRNPGAPAGLWGHADPEGKDLYNKFLSERRARAVHAALRRDTDTWEALFENPEGAAGDVWGTRAIQTMLAALEDFDGVVDGKDGPPTRAAIEKFQSEHAAEHPGPKGINSPAFRKVLFKAYMDFLCRRPVEGAPGDAETLEPYEMAAADFLSRGEGKRRGDFQGCSFFNPQLILSQSELDALKDDAGESKEARHAAHAPDRRVIIFLFRPGTQIDQAHWPCPRASEGVQKCIDRFWSDGKERMGTRFTDHRRRFGGHVPISRAELVPANPELALRMARAETTFGCRFYHGLAVGSACERDLKVWLVRLMIYAKPDDGVKRKKAEANQVRRVPLANARYVVTAGEAADAAVVRGTTTADGVMMIPLFDEEATMVLRVDAYEALFGPVFQPPGAAPPPAPSTTDPDAFPDEADFLTIPLAGGALMRALKRGPDQDPDFDPDDPPPERPEADLGAEQRLFNLGFGPRVLADWGPAELAAAVKAFKQEQAATDKEREDATGELDDATRAKIVQVYGS
jgi:hypothetical protein